MNAPDKNRPAAGIASIEHWIGGKLVPGQSGRRTDVFNPATGQVTGRVAMASSAEVAQAVANAQAAFPAWADTPAVRRARVMFKFLDLLNKHRDELARNRQPAQQHQRLQAHAAGFGDGRSVGAAAGGENAPPQPIHASTIFDDCHDLPRCHFP